jgi:hypothetical protein
VIRVRRGGPPQAPSGLPVIHGACHVSGGRFWCSMNGWQASAATRHLESGRQVYTCCIDPTVLPAVPWLQTPRRGIRPADERRSMASLPGKGDRPSGSEKAGLKRSGTSWVLRWPGDDGREGLFARTRRRNQQDGVQNAQPSRVPGPRDAAVIAPAPGDTRAVYSARDSPQRRLNPPCLLKWSPARTEKPAPARPPWRPGSYRCPAAAQARVVPRTRRKRLSCA